MHRWWYRCLTRAGVVAEGTTSGKKMHGARYTAGTEFYLATSDIYATQQLLGHADVNTTANIYVQGSPADLSKSSARSGANRRGIGTWRAETRTESGGVSPSLEDAWSSFSSASFSPPSAVSGLGRSCRTRRATGRGCGRLSSAL